MGTCKVTKFTGLKKNPGTYHAYKATMYGDIRLRNTLFFNDKLVNCIRGLCLGHDWYNDVPVQKSSDQVVGFECLCENIHSQQNRHLIYKSPESIPIYNVYDSPITAIKIVFKLLMQALLDNLISI